MIASHADEHLTWWLTNGLADFMPDLTLEGKLNDG